MLGGGAKALGRMDAHNRLGCLVSQSRPTLSAPCPMLLFPFSIWLLVTAALGIWAAARAGFEPPKKFWKTMSDHFIRTQSRDGGWSDTSGRSTANMATAGLATMFLVFDSYHGKTFYTQENPRAFGSGESAKCMDSIRRGMAWLAKHGGSNRDGYYLYGIERTGVASGRKYIGGRDWFREGAESILKAQQANGSFALGGHGGQIARAAWCTMFLVYGGAPVAFNKLEYGKNQNWNLNPRDLANLSKYMWSAYERPLNWHSVSITADAKEFEAPILFISGSEAVEFNAEELKKLRDYVARGGTILAEPSDRSPAFTKSIETLVGQLYPQADYPSYKFEQLPETHALYSVLKQDWGTKPKLRGVSSGSRVFFFLSDGYLSADWQMNRVKTDAFKLAMNILFYATDLGEMNSKFASIIPDSPAAKSRKKAFRVGRVVYGDGTDAPNDWRAGERSWKRMSERIQHCTGYELKESPFILTRARFEHADLLHITGRGKLILTAAERGALKAHAESGGTILVDACNGSKVFVESAREVLTEVFGELSPLADTSLLAAGHFEGGMDLAAGARFKLAARRDLRGRNRRARGQQLEVIKVKGRPAVIFSQYDISGALAGESAYQTLGYKPESARQIAVNLAAYLMVD